ncbi:tyrosine-type recombinase/integrase, partial [Ammoniphilus sp. 3BR4]|uniref:tyrosine-type recombinase/integrase n=1 Tax=Ammoniphilus sp. 3BR4 TaxID=3158265 RepID=UPI0034672F01
NVMAKVEMASVRVSVSKKAEKIENQILRTNDSKDEFTDFIQFVAEGYPKVYESQLTGDIKKDRGANRVIQFHRVNKERDVAILSLFLGSGLRISELVNLDIDDVNRHNRTLNVLRKGNKEDIVDFDEQALIDLEEYLEVRCERYGLSPDFKPLFVPSKVGRKGSGRMTIRGVQKMLEKYVDAYQGPNLTAHKLRHSFATRLYENSKDIVLVKDQLGHESVETTNLYTHLSNTQRKRALEHMNRGGFID